MAKTYTLKSESYNGRYLELVCNQTQNISANTSTISWTLTSKGGSASNYSTGPTTVKINGVQVYYKERVSYSTSSFPASLGSTSGTTTVSHNADGSKSISVSLSTAIYTAAVNTTSGTWTLDSNPRKATLTDAPNLSDDTETITVNYSNPGGSGVESLRLCISYNNLADNILAYTKLNKNGSSFTFDLTDELRKKFWELGNLEGSPTPQFYYGLETVVGGQTYYDSLRKEYEIINAAPVVSWTSEDVDQDTLELTGDPSIWVRGYSDIRFNIMAEPQKLATIESYTYYNGTKDIEGSSGVLNNWKDNIIIIGATDSRGQTALRNIKPSRIIEYYKPTCSQGCSIELDGETTAKVTINYKVDFFEGSFGKETNGIVTSFRHTDGQEQWTEWMDFVEGDDDDYFGGWFHYEANLVQSSQGHREIELVLTGLRYDSPYKIQCRAIDSLDHYITQEYTVQLIPVFDWGNSNFNFNVPVSFQGVEMADFVVATGTDSMGSNGTWYWRKWNSGRAECYGLRNFGNMAVSTAWGSLYESASFTQPLPSGLFSQAPHYVGIELTQASGAGWVLQGFGTDTSKDTIGSFSIVRPTAMNLQQVYLGFNCIGRWK